ncbi:protein regulator of cytokinesis 1-like isoform X2 [Hypomesus transpacificus]|uniref:protein regulator of cytokinesis 1-like isoform X2 n=1 Tax=Hypomesus transpacificus TaxID=137520 RepID=UPI001F079195|nr:protein regulator of cytokinesis 1-like isoform X2 [Hypomesus transpacificus]
MRRSEVHAAESVACLNRALNRLKDIWEEIGIPEDQRLQRTDVVKKHIKDLLEMMITEEESLRKRLLSSIESCSKELESLCQELQLPPFEEEEGSTMLQLEKDIRTRLEVMTNQKSQRIQQLKAFWKQDQELCDIMCSAPYCISLESVPSLEQLESYRAYLDSLTQEKVRRHDEFIGIKRQIIQCMEDLDQLPDTSFERDVVCEDEEAFCLSNDNISTLKLLLGQLEERKAENELRCSAYRGKIQELWERLQVPLEERDAISEHMVLSKKTNLDALQAEAGRLEELKIKNMQNVIEAIRAEIALFWERCYYSSEQRQAFVPYFDDNFTEESLNLHEAEVLNLKKQYEDHQDLFEGVGRWQESWMLFLELDKKATDPSRFNNRGGNLLKEEKQRADLQKSLPKLEKTLKTQIDLWEEEHCREFLVNGQKFIQYVQEQWQLLQNEREQEKLERQLKKTKQFEKDVQFGTTVKTPSKRRLAATPTSSKTRKLNSTCSISTPNSTLRSGGSTFQSPALRPPLSISKIPGLRTPARARTPRAQERNKENISHLYGTALGGTLRPPASPHRNFSINSVASTYSEFAKDFVNIDSTVIKSETFQRSPNLPSSRQDT